MATRRRKKEDRRERIRTAKKIAQVTLGGASIGTIIGAALVTAPFAPVIGAVLGAATSAALDAILDQDEDTIDYDEEETPL